MPGTLMGLSGSGKSTLLRHVNRLIEPTSGSVHVDGQDVMGLSGKELRALRARKIGMVFQHMALWPHKTIASNVAFGLEVQGVEKAAGRDAAEQALVKVGLGGWGERYPDELSGGMQQRVGLARALAADPDILLMDEPFSALDPLIRRDLQDEFLSLSEKSHKTTLFITHDLEEAMRIGHRIAVMKDGRIEQTGTPEAIVLQPATDYVARFVSSISVLKYISASDLAVDGTIADNAPILGPDTPLTELITRLANGADHVAIKDGDSLIGRIGRPEILGAVGRDLERRLAMDPLLNPFDYVTVPFGTWAEALLDFIVDHSRATLLAAKMPVQSFLELVQAGLLAVPPTIGLIAVVLLGWWIAGWRLAVTGLVCLSLIGLMGAWQAAMITLSIVITAVSICLIVGIPIGIAAARSDRFFRIVRPILDLMQTIPSFVYLVPVVMLFGIGDTPGVIVTCFFAITPLIRLTNLGIREVRSDLVEAARAFGASETRVLFGTQLPLARPTILAGLNQTVLLSLSMAVVASMISVEGLGRIVLEGIGRLDFGSATVGGIGIVLTAIAVDRYVQALGAAKQRDNRGA